MASSSELLVAFSAVAIAFVAVDLETGRFSGATFSSELLRREFLRDDLVGLSRFTGLAAGVFKVFDDCLVGTDGFFSIARGFF